MSEPEGVAPECGVPTAPSTCQNRHTGGTGLGVVMAVAGASAELESRRLLARAKEHERAAAADRAAAGKFEVAAVTENRVARKLSQLAAFGYTLLNDRAWPGSRRAQVDLVVVGPSGVFIVDTKAWADLRLENGRVYQGDDDVTDRFESLARLLNETQEAFASIGLAPGQVHVLAVMAGKGGIRESVHGVTIVGERDVAVHIAEHPRLPDHAVDQALAFALGHFKSLDAPADIDLTVREPVLPVVDEPVPLISDEDLRDALFESIRSEPIEDWMAFLHPEQAKLARRSFNGPSRIRGAAGTGKTVVGLHRAAHLARMNPQRRVLVTTFVKSLPAVLKNLLERMAPDVVERVDFMSVNQYASRLLAHRQIPLAIDMKAAGAAFDRAWATTKPERLTGDRGYWRDEVDHVIKGRGITVFEGYAALPRVGRKRKLGPEQRREVWNLYCAFDEELRRAGCGDWHDLANRALASVTARPDETYSHVIIDEAQDLSCSMIRLLYSLVGDTTDGLTLIGDGRQTIYPGGFTLAEVGFSLAGRGVVLSTNYRNTSEILEFAGTQIAGLDITDIEGAADAAPTALRSGTAPALDRFTSRRAHDQRLIDRIRMATAEVGTSLGDLAVLGLDWRSVGANQRALIAAGVPWIDLDKYDGTTVDAVKVGTVKRAKGLEFKHVLLAGVRGGLVDGVLPAQEADQERFELERRELYVAMTRARDSLWVGAL